MVILQVNSPPHDRHQRPFNQYRYVFIPREDLESLGYRTFKLLYWLFRQEVPVPIRENFNLKRLSIPLLQQATSKQERQEEAQLIEKCLKEKDSQGQPFLLSILAALINGQRVLINKVTKTLAPEVYYLKSLLLLLPAICRSEIAVAVGNIDEQECDWAQLLIKIINPETVRPPENCLWLNRREKKIIGFEGQKWAQDKYVKKIGNLITNGSNKLPEILEELEGITDISVSLKSLNEPDQIFGGSDSGTPTSIRLGIWGAQGAGKTVYLTMLHNCIESDTNLTITADEAARDKINYNSAKLKGDKVFCEPTPSSLKQIEIFTYTLTQESSLTRSTFELNFIDAPGEFYEEIGNLDDEGKEKVSRRASVIGKDDNHSMDIIDYLVDCDGIIFLLDPKLPKWGKRSHTIFIPKLFRSLQARAEERNSHQLNRGKLWQYMAFCVTKIDDNDELWERREKPEDLVKEVLGEAFNSLANYCYFDPDNIEYSEQNRCQFFAVSSIGRYFKNGKWHKAVREPDESQNNLTSSTYNNIYKSGYKPKSKKEDPSTSSEADLGSNDKGENEGVDDGGWEIDDIEDIPDETSKKAPTKQPTIMQEEEPQPYQVTAPIEWLIKSIQANK